ncbi:MAG: hypothetical protein WBJ21_01310 [Burkholderiaceae bacterium]|jgi:hypothetical protein
MQLQLFSIIFSGLLYVGFYNLNTSLFQALEYSAGVSWIFLPAGMRLLCTLLFAEEGAVGLFLAAATIILMKYPEMDLVTGFGAATISAGAPFLVYRCALYWGMPSTLKQLTAYRLSILILVYSAASACLHQTWFALRGLSSNPLQSFVAMFTGDLVGTLIVIYAMKMCLAAFGHLRKNA